LFLSLVVLPQFESLYANFGIGLPGLTKFLLHSRTWLPILMLTILAAMVLWPIAWRVLRYADLDRAVIDRFVLPMPLVGPVLRRNLIARWCDAVRMGVVAGMDLPASIELADEALASPGLRHDGQQLIAALNAGHGLELVHHLRVLPNTVAAAIALASEQNNLPAMLATLSDMYQQQAETRLGAVPGILTPILIIIIACILGVLVTGLFLPFVRLLSELM
jgi:type IV pilus assembly protein PilC